MLSLVLMAPLCYSVYMRILTYPDPILQKPSRPISDDEIKRGCFNDLCQEMIKTMVDNKGIGLAAPQVGKNLRIIAINHKNGPLCMINPTILNKSKRILADEEGCLSLPKVFLQINRHYSVTCEYLSVDGQKKKMQTRGLLARVLQHETDHLDGVLMINK